MTPLAHSIAKQQLLPVNQRQYRASKAKFSEWRCFDCSPVIDMATILVKKMVGDMRNGDGNLSGTLSFLPAPETWVEWKYTLSAWTQEQSLRSQPSTEFDPRRRIGFLLRDRGDGYAEVSGEMHDLEGKSELSPMFAIPVARNGDEIVKLHDLDHDGSITGTGIPGYGYFAEEPDFPHNGTTFCRGGIWATTYHVLLIYSFLAMVNSPSVVGRKVNRAHAGLQRQLSKLQGAPHGGELRPWTEIILDVTTPTNSLGDQGLGAERLTGKKALHFCRSHLRIQNGRLVRVRGHFRGDASLGIVQSRYKVV